MSSRRSNDSKVTKKRRTITMKQKLDIIKRHEEGQTLSSISRTLGHAASTIKTIVKDKERIKEHIQSSAAMNSTVITKQRSGVICEMERKLVLWIEDQNQRSIPLSLNKIQDKARKLYNDLKMKRGEVEGTFSASKGWFQRFKARANLHNVNMRCEAGNDTVPAEDFPQVFVEITEGEGYLPEHVDADETGAFLKRMHSRTYMSKDDAHIVDFNENKDRLTLLRGGNAIGYVNSAEASTEEEEIDVAKPEYVTMNGSIECFSNTNVPPERNAASYSKAAETSTEEEEIKVEETKYVTTNGLAECFKNIKNALEGNAADYCNATETRSEKEVLVQKPKVFTTNGLADCFKSINNALEGFEKMDPDVFRFANVSRKIQDAIACYKAIYVEEKSASLEGFVRKLERPTQPPLSQFSESDIDDVAAVPSPQSSSSNN